MIRQATEADLPAFEKLTEQAYASYVPMLGRKPTPMTRNYGQVVAAGYIWIEEQRRGAIVLEPFDDALLVYSIVVDPVEHGTGIGQTLLRFAVARARSAGLPKLRLCTGATMARNLKIYSDFGFVETGREDMDLPASPTIVWMEMAV